MQKNVKFHESQRKRKKEIKRRKKGKRNATVEFTFVKRTWIRIKAKNPLDFADSSFTYFTCTYIARLTHRSFFFSRCISKISDIRHSSGINSQHMHREIKREKEREREREREKGGETNESEMKRSSLQSRIYAAHLQ